ncbi:GTP-binding protein RAD, partial [Stegodyphus mimosarum]
MTPVSDLRKLSLRPDSQIVVSRSQSDTSYESLAAVMVDKRARRASEWATSDKNKKMVLRPLQLNGGDPKECNSLLYRRLSKASMKTHCTPQSAPATEALHKDGVSRTYSVKSVKKISEARQRHRGSSIPSEEGHSTGARVKERTVSNRSLPLPGDETEYLRLRNFSVTSKGVVNRGDSFRSRSASHVPGLNAGEEENVTANTATPSPVTEEPKELLAQKKPYKVLLIGAPGVGKTSMWKQFMTSDYICAFDFAAELEIDRIITVVLNNEESQIEFEEETFQDGDANVTSLDPDAFVIVYSVTDRKSYSYAKVILSQIQRHLDTKAVILVGNKTDLARLRVVSTD